MTPWPSQRMGWSEPLKRLIQRKIGDRLAVAVFEGRYDEQHTVVRVDVEGGAAASCSSTTARHCAEEPSEDHVCAGHRQGIAVTSCSTKEALSEALLRAASTN